MVCSPPSSSRYALEPGSILLSLHCMLLSKEDRFPSGKLIKLTLVLEPFRMRYEMPGSGFGLVLPLFVFMVCRPPSSSRYAFEPGSTGLGFSFWFIRKAKFKNLWTPAHGQRANELGVVRIGW